MVDNLIEKFSSPEFNPEKYVKELSHKCVGGQELQQQRKTIQAVSESTNVLLKKNVYRNYMQFIETAKEITHLESEMYQLSHLLSEQKSLLEVLTDPNNINDPSLSEVHGELEKLKVDDEKKKQKDEEDRVRILTSIFEKVEGCTGLSEVKDRILLHEGDILELDPVENTILQKTHAYLFSDALMLTSWITNGRGPVRYKMYAMYKLNTMAVVNVRDLKPIERAFKILAYPDTRLFQCSSPEAKKEWLDRLDQAKKAKLTNEKVKRESSQVQANDDSSNLDSPTTFFDDESIFSNLNIPEWFIESPEEMDVLIAERHFEDALELLTKCDKYSNSVDENEKDSVFTDIVNKIESRRKNLINELMKELEVSPEKSLQGGLRAARRAVRLLIALNKTTQACELILRLCTSIMKKELKCARREGGTVHYIRQMANIFYCTVLDVVEEFQRVFPTSPACSAALVVWSNSELTNFMSHVIKQIFVPHSSITTISECVYPLRCQNLKLYEYGLDLVYQVDGMLLKPVTIALQDTKDNIIEAVKHNLSVEKWHPINLQNRDNLNKFSQDLKDFGLTAISDYTRDDCWLDLAPCTITFTRLVMSLHEDCLILFSSQLHYVIEDVFHEIFHVQLRMFQNVARTHKQESEVRFIDKNVEFVSDHVLKLILKNFTKISKIPFDKLVAVGFEFRQSRLGKTPPKPAPRSITKYHSEEFI